MTTTEQVVAEMHRLAEDCDEQAKRWEEHQSVSSDYQGRAAAYRICAGMVERIGVDPAAPGVAERETRQPLRVWLDRHDRSTP